MKRFVFPFLFSGLFLEPLSLPVTPVQPSRQTVLSSSQNAPLTISAVPATVGTAAPLFTHQDIEGKRRSLTSMQGKPLVLFVFCGCEECKPVAERWAKLQKDGTLAPAFALNGEKVTPLTLVLYVGDEKETRAFGTRIGFDPKQTVLFADPKLEVARAYDAMPCPRVFVLDAQGMIRYTNKEEGAKSNTLSLDLLLTRTFDALRPAKKLPSSSSALETNASGLLPAKVPRKSFRLTILPDEEIKTERQAVAHVEFGKVDPKLTPRLLRTFMCRNDEKEAFVIDRIQTSCGCESVALMQNGRETKHPLLAPGGTFEIKIAVNVANHPGGKKEAYAWVYSSQCTEPVATLEMVAQIMKVEPEGGRTGATSSPALPVSSAPSSLKALTDSLSFGSLQGGKETTRRLVLTASSLASLEGLKIKKGPDWIWAVIRKPLLSGSGKPICVIDVTLKSNAPLGTLEQTLEIISRGGVLLKIPIEGTLEKN